MQKIRFTSLPDAAAAGVLVLAVVGSLLAVLRAPARAAAQPLEARLYYAGSWGVLMTTAPAQPFEPGFDRAQLHLEPAGVATVLGAFSHRDDAGQPGVAWLLQGPFEQPLPRLVARLGEAQGPIAATAAPRFHPHPSEAPDMRVGEAFLAGPYLVVDVCWRAPDARGWEPTLQLRADGRQWALKAYVLRNPRAAAAQSRERCYLAAFDLRHPADAVGAVDTAQVYRALQTRGARLQLTQWRLPLASGACLTADEAQALEATQPRLWQAWEWASRAGGPYPVCPQRPRDGAQAQALEAALTRPAASQVRLAPVP